MIRFLCFCFWVTLSTMKLAAQGTSYYISAHPDDWQLFMNPNVYYSAIKVDEKVVIIHTTAGDAGGGTTNGYYLAREEGSLRAIRFMVSTQDYGLGTNMNKEVVTLNGHNILKFTYRNIVAYFLRLPDGNMDGSGYPLSSNSSIQKLFTNEKPTISAIDNSATYMTATDLTNTIKAIVDKEKTGKSIEFNVADTDDTQNPGDHSDHLYSARIMKNVAAILGGVKINHYIDYHSSQLIKNLTEDELMVEIGTWAATGSGLSDLSYSSNWRPDHNGWIGRQYFKASTVPGYNSTAALNLALNKPATSSGDQDKTPKSAAVDGDLDTYWGNDHDPKAQWWQVDLGSDYNLKEVDIVNFFKDKRYYQYTIEAITNGGVRKVIADFSKNTEPATSDGNSFTLTNTTARYLRVNMNSNSANTGVHIVEFRAFGSPAAKSSTGRTGADEEAIGLNSSISNEAGIDLSAAATNLTLFPNPVKRGDALQIKLPSIKSGKVLIEVYDVSGKKLSSKEVNSTEELLTFEVPTDSLLSGTYILKTTHDGVRKSRKFIVE